MPINSGMQMVIKQWLLLFGLISWWALFTTAQADYVIGAGDAVAIKVYGYEDLNTETRVADNGVIAFPLVGEIKLGGLSALEAGRVLAQRLGAGGFIRDAQITVTVLDYKSQQVSVLGQVNRPGQYPLEAVSSLVEVIALAGGIGALGEDRVIITRNRNGKPVKEEIDLRTMLEYPETTKPVIIQKGDVLYIPKAPVFYIQGEVQRPGSFRLEPNMTVAQAISVGGGLTPKGTLRDIEIERRNAQGNIRTLRVNLTDLVLKDDVLIVDERLF